MALVSKNVKRLVQIFDDKLYDGRYAIKTAGYTHMHLPAINSLDKKPGIRKQATTQKRQCPVVQTLLADATKHVLPDGQLVLYFFASIRDEVMQQVLKNIQHPSSSNRRMIYLMYLAPAHESMVMETEVLKRVSTH